MEKLSSISGTLTKGKNFIVVFVLGNCGSAYNSKDVSSCLKEMCLLCFITLPRGKCLLCLLQWDVLYSLIYRVCLINQQSCSAVKIMWMRVLYFYWAWNLVIALFYQYGLKTTGYSYFNNTYCSDKLVVMVTNPRRHPYIYFVIVTAWLHKLM